MSKKEMMENCKCDEEETEDENSSNDEESSPTPVRLGRHQVKENSGTTRRMVHSHTSKAAVQWMEMEYIPKSSGKKPSRKIRSKHTPLSPIAMNKTSSDSDDNKTTSFDPDKGYDLTEFSLSDSENESSSLSEVSEYIIPNDDGHKIVFDKPSLDAGVVSVQMATGLDIDTFGVYDLPCRRFLLLDSWSAFCSLGLLSLFD